MNKRILKIFIGFVVFFCGTIESQGQRPYYPFFQQEYFTGWNVSPRTEAMGRADVAVGGSVHSVYQNPAGIGKIEHADFSFSTAAPFYLLANSDYFFLGGAYRVHPKVIVAVSLNQLSIGETYFSIDINGTSYPLNRPRSSNFAFSAAATPIKNLHIGVNLNYFRWKYLKEVGPSRTIHLDMGALYSYYLKGENDQNGRGLSVGLSVSNLTSAIVKFSSPAGDVGQNYLPVYGRYAVSYFDNWTVGFPKVKSEGNISLIVTLEIEDIINSDYRTSVELGSEISLYNFLAFRLGMYTRTADDMGIATNLDRVTGVTYGFGLQIPVSHLSAGKVPIDVHVDYTSHNQPDAVERPSYTPNMRAFGLRVVWTPINNSKS